MTGARWRFAAVLVALAVAVLAGAALAASGLRSASPLGEPLPSPVRTGAAPLAQATGVARPLPVAPATAAWQTVVARLAPPTALPNPRATADWFTAVARLPSPTPRPTETPPAASAYFMQDSTLTPDARGWHGPPPFTLQLAGLVSNYGRGAVACVTATWDWGDGATETRPCAPLRPANGPALTGSVGRHVYTRAGAYTVRLRLTLNDRSAADAPPGTATISPFDVAGGTDTPIKPWIWGGALAGALLTLLAVRLWGGPGRRWGYALVGLVVFTILPPFSYLPNPAGLIWTIAGGYSYDPRLPFANGMVIADDPTLGLKWQLEGLRGQTGLDPLDPRQPLVGYAFDRVRIGDPLAEVAWVRTRFIYADGSARTYDVPTPSHGRVSGLYRRSEYAYWYEQGLGRVSAPHTAIFDVPLAGDAAPVRLAPPAPLPVNPATARLLPADPDNWTLRSYYPRQRLPGLALAPAGDAVLLPDAQRALWLAPLDTTAPRRVASQATWSEWSPDGRWIVYGGADGAVLVAPRDGATAAREIARPASAARVGLSRDGAWYVEGDTVWRAPFDGAERQAVGTVTAPSESGIVRPAPDGAVFAYACAVGVCLASAGGAPRGVAGLRMEDATWSPDAARLAVVGAGAALLARDGTLLRALALPTSNPQLAYDAPQWTADGRYVVFPVGAYGGRRIFMADAGSGQVWDATPPRWDPLFAVLPAGRGLLVTNGRGGFWTSALIAAP
jgi:hypothetical protein